MVVVAEASDGLRALSQIRAARPDVALVAGDLPGLDGVKTVVAIRKEGIPTRVVILSEDEDLELMMEALEAGATGYVTGTCGLSQLVEAVRTVDRGGTIVPTMLLGPMLDRLFRRRRDQDAMMRRLPRITPRERTVLALLAEGASNQSIAESLGISSETARTHVQHLLAKLGVHSKLEAAAFVLQNGALHDLLDDDVEPIANHG